MKAWELIEQTGWCQNVYARAANGQGASVEDPNAVSYCARGAIEVTHKNDLTDAIDRLYQGIHDKYRLTVIEWNDAPERTKEEVIAVLKELDL